MKPAERLPWHPAYRYIRVEEEEGMVSIPTRVESRIRLVSLHPSPLDVGRMGIRIASIHRASWGHESFEMDHNGTVWGNECVSVVDELPLGPITRAVRTFESHPEWSPAPLFEEPLKEAETAW